MSQPKVSVIIPVYNTERYLSECLDSVVNQTLKDIEIICVDDGSTDGSLAILREYESKDHRIKILTQEKSNAGEARNFGLSQAKGMYLSFLDADDFFELTMLEHMYACAQNRNADIVVCEMKQFFDASGEYVCVDWHIRKDLLPTKSVFSFRDIQRNAFRCIVSYAWDKLIKRDLVIENVLHFQSQPVYNDAVFIYKAMISAGSITVLDECLVYYRKRSSKDAVTNSRYEHIDCVYSVLRELKDHLIKIGLYERYKRDFACYAIHMMNHTYSSSINDPAVIKEIRNNYLLWLVEFDIVGHQAYYYYEFPEYWKLLEKVQLQSELDRLRASWPYRIGRVFIWGSWAIHGVYQSLNEKGMRLTIHRIGEKLKGRSV